jgi:hypothetical protein
VFILPKKIAVAKELKKELEDAKFCRYIMPSDLPNIICYAALE